MPDRTFQSHRHSRPANATAATKALRRLRTWGLNAVVALMVLAALALALMTRPASTHLDSVALQAQTPDAAQPVAPPHSDPPGTIDGAKNPELIPDDVALRMIVLAVAEPAEASEEAKKRALAKLSPIGLSQEDATAFLGLLAEFRTQADPVEKQAADIWARSAIPHPESTDYQQLAALGKQQKQLIANAIAALPARLSEDGQQRLAAYLAQAKKGMKMIPDMPMPE